MKQSTPDPKQDEKAEPEERKSPQDWAEHLGAVKRLMVPLGESYFADPRHPMARVIHGWAAHEYHEGGPLLLTLEDYQAALKAAEKRPYVAHKPAKTKYAPEYDRDDK